MGACCTEKKSGQAKYNHVACPEAPVALDGADDRDFDEALSAVRDVGPGGHYLGYAHTLENFKNAFYMPKLFDNNSYEQWIAEGSQNLPERALKEAKSLLRDCEEPKLDEALNEALLAYINRREREIPAKDSLNNEH